MERDRPPRRIDSLEAARALFADLLTGARQERLYVAHLDADKGLLGLQMRFGAAEPQIDFPIRGIVGEALRLNSALLICAHNHPSGDPKPTPTDVEMTRKLVQAARPLGISVHDHLIFADDAFVSFRRLGLL
jgi:DNA repair protein RadC